LYISHYLSYRRKALGTIFDACWSEKRNAMSKMLIFGLGYSAARVAQKLRAKGWHINATGSAGNIAFDDRPAVLSALRTASYVLSSVPPDRESGDDPVLARYGGDIAAADLKWLGYLSSTGVYGDSKGAWVDESSPTGTGRWSARATADVAWQSLNHAVRVFRLPGIYGPGRSALDRVRSGKANRIDLPDQIFSRVHVDDIARGIVASFDGPPGIYNLADDRPCSQNRVIEQACQLLGYPLPPLLSLDEAQLSPMARDFYTENRRVANGRAKRHLGWRPLYPDHVAGLTAIFEQETRASDPNDRT